MGKLRLAWRQHKHTKRQRKYTQDHRRDEMDGLRLMQLDDHLPVTFNGMAAWCDAQLQECPHPLHDLCCLCRHFQSDPNKGATS